MIKIVLALPSFRGGGAERVMLNIANNLDKNIFDVNFIVLSDEGPYKKLLSQKVNVINLNTYHVKKSFHKMINAVNHLDPDVILSTHEHLNLLFLIT